MGTKLWKEFAWEGPVETRYMERLSDGSWTFATYVWSADGRDAVLAPERGVRGAHETSPGVFHDVPGRRDCRVCHDAKGSTQVLGFSALQLSPDRDPLAPHADAPPAGAADLASLVAAGRVRGLPPALIARPPRIDAPTPRARAAIGYLHANCGTCHNGAGALAPLGLDLEVSVATGRSGASPARGLCDESRFRPAGCADRLRVSPGDAAHSVLVARMASRAPAVQMPPLGTHRIDADALALVGVAMGSGTDVARECAGIVLIGDDLLKLVETVRIARRCRRIILVNFAGTIVVDGAGMLLAACGLLAPVAASLVHVGSEIAFILNSARLLAKPRGLPR